MLLIQQFFLADFPKDLIMVMTPAAINGWRCVMGGFAVHLVLGSLYCWSNITMAVTSYIREYHGNVSYGDTLAVYASQLAMQGPSMYLGGLISEKYGPQRTMMLGGAILVAGTLLASTATSLWGLILTYGVPFGTGMGIMYAAPIAEAIKWMPHKKGLFTGIIVAGFGAGAFVFGQVAIAVVNPENENVNEDTDYFDDNSPVPDRVPMMFLVLGCCYFVFFCIGIALVVEKPIHHIALSTADGDCVEAGNAIAVEDQQDPLLVKMMSSDRDDGDNDDDDSDDPSPIAKRSYAPSELYCMPLMWHVASCFVCTSAGGMYLAGTFKMYGEDYIRSEEFLTLVAETAAVFNAAGRIFWGYMADRYSTITTLQVKRRTSV